MHAIEIVYFECWAWACLTTHHLTFCIILVNNMLLFKTFKIYQSNRDRACNRREMSKIQVSISSHVCLYIELQLVYLLIHGLLFQIKPICKQSKLFYTLWRLFTTTYYRYSSSLYRAGYKILVTHSAVIHYFHFVSRILYNPGKQYVAFQDVQDLSI